MADFNFFSKKWQSYFPFEININLKNIIAFFYPSKQTNKSVENFYSPQESFYMQSFSDSKFMHYKKWREEFKNNLRDTFRKIINAEARELQKHITTQIISPFFYHTALDKLKQKITSIIPEYPIHIFNEAQVRLENKLDENPDLAFEYFYNDLVNHLIDLSGRQISLESFDAMLEYYREKIHAELYDNIVTIWQTFLSKYTSSSNENFLYNNISAAEYRKLGKQIDLAFINLPWSASYWESATQFVKENSKTIFTVGNAVILGSGITWLLSRKWDSSLTALSLQTINFIQSQQFATGAIPRVSLLFFFPVTYAATTSIFRNQAQQFLFTSGSTKGDELSSIIQTNDHNILSAGITQDYDAIDQDIFIIKRDINGNQLWSSIFNRLGIDSVSEIIQTQDQGIALLGETQTTNFYTSILLIKLFSNGDYAWARTYSGIKNNFASAIAEAKDGSGNLFIGGYSDSFGLTNRALTIKLDPNGNIIWASIFDSCLDNHCFGSRTYDLITTSDNTLISVGISYIAFVNKEPGTSLRFKQFFNGTLSWAILDSETQTEANLVAENQNNNFLLVGSNLIEAIPISKDQTYTIRKNSENILLMEFYANGSYAVVKTFGEKPDNGKGYQQNPRGFFISNNNNLVIGGYTTFSQQIFLASFNSNLSQLQWLQGLGNADDDSDVAAINNLVNNNFALAGTLNNDALTAQFDSEGNISHCDLLSARRLKNELKLYSLPSWEDMDVSNGNFLIITEQLIISNWSGTNFHEITLKDKLICSQPFPWAIVVGVIGGILTITIIGGTTFFLCYKRSSHLKKPQENTMPDKFYSLEAKHFSNQQDIIHQIQNELYSPEKLQEMVAAPEKFGLANNGISHILISGIIENESEESLLQKLEEVSSFNLAEKDNRYGNSPLHWCALLNYPKLQDHISDPLPIAAQNKFGFTAPHLAILTGKQEAFLAHFSQRSEFQILTLKFTNAEGKEKIIELNDLHLAIATNQKSIVEEIFRRKKINTEVHGLGNILHLIVYIAIGETFHHPKEEPKVATEMLALLLKKSFPNKAISSLLTETAVNNEKLAPLSLAAKHNQVTILAELLRYIKLHVNETDGIREVEKAFYTAAQEGQLGILKLFVFYYGFQPKANHQEYNDTIQFLAQSANQNLRSAYNFIDKTVKIEYFQLFDKPNAIAQSYETLVFQGGGGKGVILLFLISQLKLFLSQRSNKVFDKFKQTSLQFDNLNRMAGTSVGALFAYAVAIGCPLEKMLARQDYDFSKFLESEYINNAVKEFDSKNPSAVKIIEEACKQLEIKLQATLTTYKKINESDHPKLSAAWQATKHGKAIFEELIALIDNIKQLDRTFTGFCEGTELESFLKDILEDAGLKDFPNITFGELRGLIDQDSKKYKHLHVAVTNLTQRKVEILSTENPEYENYLVIPAVLCSARYPVIFKTGHLKIKVKNSIITLPDECADGGLLFNSLIGEFDFKKFVENDAHGDPKFPVFNPKVLGIHFKSNSASKNSSLKEAPHPLLAHIFAYIELLLKAEVIINQHSDKPYGRAMEVDTGNFTTYTFKRLTKEEKFNLIQQSQSAIENYFQEQIKEEFKFTLEKEIKLDVIAMSGEWNKRNSASRPELKEEEKQEEKREEYSAFSLANLD